MVIRRIIFFLIVSNLFITIPYARSAGEDSLPSSKIALPKDYVSKNVLENGLTVLVKRQDPEDLVSINVKIRAGSSLEDEYLGSGISHFIEHMVFKGTKLRQSGDIEREIKSYGGFINGAVTKDLTTFHVTAPAKYFVNCLSILRDMLSNAVFDKEELAREREVISKEINLHDDEPQSLLLKTLYENAYLRHSYKYPIIGYRKKLESLTRDDLVKYYERMYVPNRIVIAAAGGVEESQVLSAIEKEFKDFREPNYKPALQDAEALQMGRRYVEKNCQTALSHLAMAFHSTSVLDKDLFALDVLSMILGAGDESRLNRSLYKDKALVYSIASWNYTARDPGLFIITASLDGSNLEKAEKEVINEIGRIKNGALDDAELETARRMVLSSYIFSRQTVEGQANDICISEILTGDRHFSNRYVDGIQSVTKADIKRAANIYLTEDNLTVVSLVPPDFKGPQHQGPAIGQPHAAGEGITKEILPNGVRVLLHKDDKTPTACVTLAFFGGLLVEDEGTSGISNLTARMLLKGTQDRDEAAIRGAIESLGGTIDSFSGFNSFGLNVSVLKDDVDFALTLLSDILTRPTFPEGELEKEKNLITAMIKDEDDDMFRRGSNALRKDLFGTHPYAMRPLGEAPIIRSMNREDILNFYKTWCVANNMVLSISGDIDSKSLIDKAKGLFDRMKGREVPRILSKGSAKTKPIINETIRMEKTENLIMIGFKTIDIKDPDRYAFDLLSSVLSGYSGRLYGELRDRLSLAYSLGCSQRLGLDTGYLVLYVATTKDKIQASRTALIDQIKNIRQEPVSDDEFLSAKRELIGGYKIERQTNDFMALHSALDELYGLGHDNIFKYEERIDKVRKEDLKRIAEKYLDIESRVEVIITSK